MEETSSLNETISNSGSDILLVRPKTSERPKSSKPHASIVVVEDDEDAPNEDSQK